MIQVPEKVQALKERKDRNLQDFIANESDEGQAKKRLEETKELISQLQRKKLELINEGEVIRMEEEKLKKQEERIASGQNLRKALKVLENRKKENLSETLVNQNEREKAMEWTSQLERKEGELLQQRKVIGMEEERLLRDQFLVNRSIRSRGLQTEKDPYLPFELWTRVAEYCSAADYLSIRLLCVGIQKVIILKIPLLNLRPFKESICDLVKYYTRKGAPTPLKFKLNPLVAEKEPFAVMQIFSDHLKDTGLKKILNTYKTSALLQQISYSVGDCLEKAILKALQHPNHPKFSLLTLPLASFANCTPAMNFHLLPANRSKIQNDYFQLSIDYACEVGCPESLKIMIDLNDPRAHPSNSIQAAVKRGNTSCVRMLLQDPRVNPADENNACFCEAVRRRNLEICYLLLQDARVSPDANDNLCIQMASEWGATEMVQFLLSTRGVDPSASINACIRRASAKGHTAAVRLLLSDSRVDPSAWENEAFRNASENGHTEIASLLLAHPQIDPIACKSESLRMAAKNGHIAIVQLLLADPRLEGTPYRKLALNSAKKNDHREIVTLLEEHLKKVIVKPPRKKKGKESGVEVTDNDDDDEEYYYYDEEYSYYDDDCC